MDEKIELLKTTNAYIINLKSQISKAADCFQRGEDENGFNMVPSIAEGIDGIVKALKVTKDVLKQDISVDDLNEKLNEIVEAIENQDTLLIGDLFQYELIPIFENIEQCVNSSVK
ncbi:hypothetical protein [Clostridium tyrobutyricum]|uniref:hypothetical protein n=1 Tax=Clostridium tyrobutyricum TaxID=1519 RepID=UPI0018AA05CC|nr:hypothetical protein [Clostridium tyrobutyricum]